MKMIAHLSKGLLGICLLSGSVQAGWPELKREMHTDKLRNNAWPQPFRGVDAAAVVTPFELQKNNGWRQFNTIGSAFFDNTHALTDAGAHKIAVGLTKVPSNRRVIYVLKGETPTDTATRVESVQIAVSKMIPVGPLPEILVTDQDNASVSGEYETLINRGLARTTPAPRLPKFNGLNTPANQSQMNISP